MSKEFNILLYGANSFSAKFIIPYLENYQLKIGVASRNVNKIIETSLIKIECVLEDAPSKCDILINCVGPYIFTGENVIKNCIESKTHYIDLCGEVHFIKYIYAKYNSDALKANIFIIQACGFDSLIADIGTEIIKKDFERDIEIRSILELKKLVGNLGTWESLLESISRYKKNTSNKESNIKAKSPLYFYDKNLKSYMVKFMGSDHFVVSSTQKKLKECNMTICKYKAYLKIDSIFLYFLFVYLISFICKLPFGKKLLIYFYKFFSFGLVEKNPEGEKVKEGSFLMNFEGVGMKNTEYVSKNLKISGPDLYTTTGICVSQSALVLYELLEKRKNEENIWNYPGGVLTPGIVFRSDDIQEKLVKLGISFTKNY